MAEAKVVEADLFAALFSSGVTPYPTGGFELRGTLQSLVAAVLSEVEDIAGRSLPVSNVPGDYSVNIQVRQPGSELYRVDLGIRGDTGPDPVQGNQVDQASTAGEAGVADDQVGP